MAAAIDPSVALSAAETLPGGVRPSAAYADAIVVVAEPAETCRSQRQFLKAVAAARAS